jgi:acyl-[acyl-carrier-protein]-phospholipid O-acyltransferase/long-chain-fatty-acid--[acyl-carrier-protein] ligase
MPDVFDPQDARTTLFAALVDASRRFGRAKPILEDPERDPMSYGRLILGSLVIGERLASGTRRGEVVGVLMPNVSAVAVVLFGLSAYGRVAGMLNFTAGLRNLASAVRTGRIRTIVTSRRFVEQAKLDETIAALAAGDSAADRAPVRILYLEDLRQEVSSLGKLLGVLRARVPGLVHARHALKPDDPAVVLFTSGTEGEPKGVALSNANLLSNLRQIEAHFGTPPLGPGQVVFNPLPIFHSYGLTGGLLLPVCTGMKTVLYPSPLHYRQVPKLVGEVGATLLFGTDTFLQGWAKAARPEDIAGVRYVVAGAERVRDETRQLWSKGGTIILEGYGATECSPVIAVNQPSANRPGTVGRFLPGLEYELESVEGMPEGGRLRVRGTNVMAGYLLHDRPGELRPPVDGWHDTGDIVSVDPEGYVRILGRAKRFAKIGGEMVSLAAIETLASGLWPGASHVAVTLPDARKGEQIVLVTDKPDAERADLLAHAQKQGYPELWVPRAVLVTAAIPVLGSGKTDYAAARDLAATMRPLL